MKINLTKKNIISEITLFIFVILFAASTFFTSCNKDNVHQANTDTKDNVVNLNVGDTIDVLSDADGTFELGIETMEGSELFWVMIYASNWRRNLQASYQISTSQHESFSRRQLIQKDNEKKQKCLMRTERSSPAHLRDLPRIIPALIDGRTYQVNNYQNRLVAPKDVRSFFVSGNNRIVEIEAEAVYVARHVVLWLDISSENPAEISLEDQEEIITQYEDVILPREKIFFGEIPDTNGDGIIHLLMSEVVHENNGPIAYFNPCDLLDSTIPECSYSNKAEIIYLTPPNAIEAPMNTPRAILETMAHETNHLIYFYTKYLQHNNFEFRNNIYLQEGLAALAQDLTGYQAGNLFVSYFGLNDILNFSVFDVLSDYGKYLSHRDGGLRGGSYLFMRYLYDQAGGDVAYDDGTFEDRGGISFVHQLHNSSTQGLEGVENLLSKPLSEVIFDFYTALALTNRGLDHGPITDNTSFNYLPTQQDPITGRQRGFDAYAPLHGMSMRGPAFVNLNDADGILGSTGIEYVQIAALRSEPIVTVRVESSTEDALKVRIVRIQ